VGGRTYPVRGVALGRSLDKYIVPDVSLFKIRGIAVDVNRDQIRYGLLVDDKIGGVGRQRLEGNRAGERGGSARIASSRTDAKRRTLFLGVRRCVSSIKSL